VGEAVKMHDMIINSSRTSVRRWPPQRSRNTPHSTRSSFTRLGSRWVPRQPKVVAVFVCTVARVCCAYGCTFAAASAIRLTYCFYVARGLSQKQADFIDLWGIHGNLKDFTERSRTAVLRVCCEDPQRSATSSRGIRGYISIMAILKFIFFN